MDMENGGQKHTGAGAIYQIPITVLIDTDASQSALAVEHVGQIRELLPIRMESVLAQFRVRRHDLEARYESIRQITPFREEPIGGETGAPSRRTRPVATFRVPLEVLMELPAEGAAEALRKVEQVLGAVPVQMQEAFAQFRVVGVLPEIHSERIVPVFGEEGP